MSTTAELINTLQNEIDNTYIRGYNAGQNSFSNLHIKKVGFDNWHTNIVKKEEIAAGEGYGCRSDSYFEHELGTIPNFVMLYANNVEAILGSIPSDLSAAIIQADRFRDCTCTYIRLVGDAFNLGSTIDQSRLITGWDATKVYVNAATSKYAWPPKEISTFTLISGV